MSTVLTGTLEEGNPGPQKCDLLLLLLELTPLLFYFLVRNTLRCPDQVTVGCASNA